MKKWVNVAGIAAEIVKPPPMKPAGCKPGCPTSNTAEDGKTAEDGTTVWTPEHMGDEMKMEGLSFCLILPLCNSTFQINK